MKKEISALSEHFQIHKNFYKDAKKLRTEFEANFKNPRQTDSKRFVWDYWYFEDQYHLIRTPAVHYFTKNNYIDFHSHLVQWGRENLGCHDISPPWLSYYVDGCFQNLHSDVPHGPWAFVYSLTSKESIAQKSFRGGETLILKPKTLNYWSSFQDQTDHEYETFADRISVDYNQLVIFDPRYPHGVTEVKGTRDPLNSRLVLHGWFVEPRPYVVGGLSTAQVSKALGPQFLEIENQLADLGPINGMVSLRLKVSKTGQIQFIKVISNTVVSLENNEQDEKILALSLKSIFKKVQFPSSKNDSWITIPILFK